MKINFQNLKYKRNKGFTLVELIVVLVILAILAAILVPALLGYIDRAKNQKYIYQCRELMLAAQTGIAEAYAKPNIKESFEASLRDKTGFYDNKRYGYFSSLWAGKVINGVSIDNETNARGGAFKKQICKKMAMYVEHQDYTVSTERPAAKDKASKFKNGAAFFIAYNERGKIIYMQFANEGKMVTFDGESYTVEDDGAFIDYDNPPKTQ